MAVTTDEAKLKPSPAHLDLFKRFEREPKQPSWLFPLRKAGLARFAERGFPSLEDEDWRFTNVAPVARLPFKPVFDGATNSVSRDTLVKFTFSSIPASRLVFVDGHYSADLSSPAPLPSGVIAGSLAENLATKSALLEEYLGRYAVD